MTLIQDHPREYCVYKNIIHNCSPKGYRTTSYEKIKIDVCSEWINGGFKAFLNDVGTKPSEKHKLLRKDPKIGYFPYNCEWSLSSPRRVDNILITIGEMTETLFYWCKKYKLDYGNTHRKINTTFKEYKTTEAFKKILKKVKNILV